MKLSKYLKYVTLNLIPKLRLLSGRRLLLDDY